MVLLEFMQTHFASLFSSTFLFKHYYWAWIIDFSPESGDICWFLSSATCPDCLMHVHMVLTWINIFNCRLRAAGRANGDGTKKTRTHDRAPRAVPAPEANAELQANLDVSHTYYYTFNYSLIAISFSRLSKVSLLCN